MNLVTIKTFFYDHGTILYKTKFRSEGIPYFLKDQKTVAFDPLVSKASATFAVINGLNSIGNLADRYWKQF